MSEKNIIRLWNESIDFIDGWFLFADGKGNYSVISEKCARNKIAWFQEYQASQDIGRGGVPEDVAYTGRGFKRTESGYVYAGTEIDRLINGAVNPIEKVLIIPQKVGSHLINYIEKDAFAGEETIEKVVFHKQIKRIGQNAFSGCVNLSSLEGLPDGVVMGDGVFDNTNVFANESIQYFQDCLVKADESCSGEIVVREGTKTISDKAFENCKHITRIVLPEGLLQIGNFAFRGCESLERIVFPKQMEYIGGSAFYGCIKLDKVMIPQGVEELSASLFEDCESLYDIQIPCGIKNINYRTFYNTAFMNRFKESDEVDLYLGDWLILYKNDQDRFLDVRQGTVGIAEADYMSKKSLGAVHLPNTIKYIGANAFRTCEINEISLPEGVISIGTAAFRETKIKKIIIPESVEQIEKWAFMRCYDLEKIIVKGKNTQIIWPAITEETVVVGWEQSPAHRYCMEYGDKYHIVFEKYGNNFY